MFLRFTSLLLLLLTLTSGAVQSAPGPGPGFSYQPAIRLAASTDPAWLTAPCAGPAVQTVATADYVQPGEAKLFATFQYGGTGYVSLSDGIYTKTVGLGIIGPPPWNEVCGAPCVIYMPAYPGHQTHVSLSVQAEPHCYGVQLAAIWDWVIMIGP